MKHASSVKVDASGHGSVVVSRRQTRALSQDVHRPAANNLDNDLDHVLAEFDEDPYLGEDLGGSASIWKHSRAPANAFMMEHLQP